jgi:hypothetical protein
MMLRGERPGASMAHESQRDSAFLRVLTLQQPPASLSLDVAVW